MSALQDKIDALLPSDVEDNITAAKMRECMHFLTDLIAVSKQGGGFDREDLTTIGIIQFCHRASTAEIHQIDENGAYTKLEAQTHFADGTTPIADLTVAQYHSAGETSFSYWYAGDWVEETGIKTLALPDTLPAEGHGGGYIHYNVSGELELSTSNHDSIVKETLVTVLYWNTDVDEFLYYADERHGLIRDPMTHKYDHNTHGFAWAKFNGSIDIEGLENNVNTFTGISDGTCSDEDIPTHFSGITTGAHMYRDGALGQWRIDSVSNALGIFVGGVLAWNDNDVNGDASDVWGLTPLTGDTQFLSPVFFLSNNVLHPLMIACSQYWKESRSVARERTEFQSFRMQMSGMPGAEMLAIGSVLIHNRTTGQVETGSDKELWVCLKRDFPVSRFEDEEVVDGP